MRLLLFFGQFDLLIFLRSEGCSGEDQHADEQRERFAFSVTTFHDEC